MGGWRLGGFLQFLGSRENLFRGESIVKSKGKMERDFLIGKTEAHIYQKKENLGSGAGWITQYLNILRLQSKLCRLCVSRKMYYYHRTL